LDFKPWRPAHILAGAKLLSFGLSTNWERELLRADLVRELGPERAAQIDPVYPAGNPIVMRPGEAWDGDGRGLAEQLKAVREQIGLAGAAGGSNNGPSAGAAPAAAARGRPALPTGMPGSGTSARGAGRPPPRRHFRIQDHDGQNNDVAWTFTNVIADVEDLFIQRIEAPPGSRASGASWRWSRRRSTSRAASRCAADPISTAAHRQRRARRGLSQRWRCAGPPRRPGIGRAHSKIFDPSGGEAGGAAGARRCRSQPVWADRP
jgi:acyl-homoserine lactone acylase PvdQ